MESQSNSLPGHFLVALTFSLPHLPVSEPGTTHWFLATEVAILPNLLHGQPPEGSLVQR